MPKLFSKFSHFKGCFLISILVLLSSCSNFSISLKPKICQGTWEKWGKIDAKQGRPLKYFQSRYKTCQDSPQKMAYKKYRKARKSLLLASCDPKLGLKRGKAGKAAFEFCPQKLKRTYFESYAQGLKEFQMRKKISALERQISKLKGALKDLPPLTQKRKFKQIEGLYLEKRKWAQNLKDFLISKKVN